jgi:hypothetical protein
MTFEVIKHNITDVVTLSGFNTSLFTASMSQDGKYLTVTARRHFDPIVGLDAEIRLNSGGQTAILDITQSKAVEGVRAKPGVIGYYANGANVGTLTLDGDDGNNTDIVYTAYFKWGSLVATSGQNDGPFVAEDIVTAKGYGGGSLTDVNATNTLKAIVGEGNTSQNKWNLVPYGDNLADTSTAATWPATAPQVGWGDPCAHYFGGDWKTPAQQNNIDFVGRNSGNISGQDYNGVVYYNLTENDGTPTSPNVGTFPAGLAQGASLFAAGYRDATGAITSQGTAGRYWSSTPSNTTPATNGYLLSVAATGYPSASASYANGNAVRCVSALPSLAVSPTSYEFPAQGGTMTFDVIASNITEPIKINGSSTTNVWDISLSEDGKTLTVTATPNFDYNMTTGGTLLLSANGKNAVLSLYQQHSAWGVRATPGVIGYHAVGPKAGELTLDGDNGIDTDREVVFVAYFKIGSLIALDSQNNIPFNSGSIVKVPDKTSGGFPYTLKEYRATVTGSGTEAWDKIKNLGDSEVGFMSNDIITDYLVGDEFLQKGLGDPCAYYFDGYRLPTNLENRWFAGGPATGTTEQTYWKYFNPTNSNYVDYYYGDPGSLNLNDAYNYGVFDYYDHYESHAGTVQDPHTGSFPVVENESDYPGIAAFSHSLPAAGYRTQASFISAGSSGHYLSSSFNGYFGYNNVFQLTFSSQKVWPGHSEIPNDASAYTARCVRDE